MFKKFLISCLMLILLLSMSACSFSKSDKDKKASDGKVTVVVSFNPLKEFTEAIGKDKVKVTSLIPNGTEPHEYEPKTSDLKELSNCDLFIYNGLGMESWADKAIKSASNDKLETLDSSSGISAIKNTDKDEIEEHGKYDPHIWLSLKCAETQSKNIKDKLCKIDPDNKDFYEKNYKDFYEKLDSLYNDYSKKFSDVSSKDFVTGHAAFAYFCRDYGLKQNSVEDTFAEGEPTAEKLKELTNYCKDNNIKTVFTEEMVSTKVSETLAKEVNAKVYKIYTLESKEDGKDYLSAMKDNLEMVYNSLK